MKENFSLRGLGSSIAQAGLPVGQIATRALLRVRNKVLVKKLPAAVSGFGLLALGMLAGAVSSQAQTYLAAAGGNALSGSASIGACGAACPGGLNAQNLGGPRYGNIVFNHISAPAPGSYKVSITYDNGTNNNLPAAVSVNGGTAIRVDLPPTGSWSISKIVVANLSLSAGSNAIKFAGVGSGWAAELCSLTVSAPTPKPVPTPTPTPTPPPTPTPAPNSVSVSTFGTVGQGGDDTQVFQSALSATAQSGEQLVIPAGNYNTNTLTISS
ncbi:MAG TPA: hypothetical protein VHZ55_19285, partial [Bryobacteraceae bacterium]|nr:hypothetical protein [Bryobacteraceae bacterium]